MEALLAAVILAVAITAITVPFTAAAQNQQDEARSTLAVSLAQGMMEEILSKPFRDPQGSTQVGPDPGETSRSLFDNIDDYDGYTEGPGQIVTLNGKLVNDPAGVGLSRHVSTTYVYVSDQNTTVPSTFIRVTVTMKYRNQSVVILTRLAYAMQP